MTPPGSAGLGVANRRVAAALCAVVVCMVGLAYASVPLYELFCRVTGFGGTTQIAERASEEIIDRTVTVRFNADVTPGLDWSFAPVQREVTLKLGETGVANYRVVNRSEKSIVGTATFNVTPLKIGLYFNKLECFCFTEQLLTPGQTVDMPVEFFVDPELARDPATRDVTLITLSYTFFEAPEPEADAPVQTSRRVVD